MLKVARVFTNSQAAVLLGVLVNSGRTETRGVKRPPASYHRQSPCDCGSNSAGNYAFHFMHAFSPSLKLRRPKFPPSSKQLSCWEVGGLWACIPVYSSNLKRLNDYHKGHSSPAKLRHPVAQNARMERRFWHGDDLAIGVF